MGRPGRGSPARVDLVDLDRTHGRIGSAISTRGPGPVGRAGGESAGSMTEATAYDVAVLGAGAAGLVAAFRAAERGRRVVLIEKNRRPGVKILISGGTRCNLTNARGLRRLEVVSGPIDPAYDP